MRDNELRKNAIGVTLTITFKDDSDSAIDVSSATTKSIYLQDPAGTVNTHTADFTTDGSDGKIKYTTAATSDLDLCGTWRIQGHVSSSSWNYKSTWDDFVVHGNLA